MSAQPEETILFNINNSPHVRDPDSTPRIMFTVCLALVPALIWSVVVFGWRALTVVVASVVACVVAEAILTKWRGRPSSLRDGSAIVTGLLLAAVCPVNLPWWAAALGGIFAMGIGKHAFGGLGHNIWNPALLARAFMQVSMPDRMMSGEWPHLGITAKWWNNLMYDLGGTFAQISDRIKAIPDAVTQATSDAASAASSATSATIQGVDVMTGATALAGMHMPAAQQLADQTYAIPAALQPTWEEIFLTWFGAEGGTIGEVSAVLLILGGLFLMVRKIVTWQIPLCFIATVAVLGFALPHPYVAGAATAYTEWFHGPWLMHLGAGGLMLGAFFMATDMVTKPLSKKGQIIFGIGCGCVTMLVRLFAGYPEGVCYAILFMNTCVPLIDNLTKPKVFGARKK